MALVQHASGNATSGTTVTATFGSATGAGHTIIVCTSGWASSSPGISGGALTGSSDTFTSAETVNQTTAAGTIGIWYDNAISAGHTAVVMTYGGTLQAASIDVFEWAGILVPSPLDAKNDATATGASSWSSGSSGTLSKPSEVAFGVVSGLNGSSASFTGPSSPWTNESQLNPATGYAQLSGYQQVAATTALTYNGTCNGGTYYGACIATFKLASSGLLMTFL